MRSLLIILGIIALALLILWFVGIRLNVNA